MYSCCLLQCFDFCAGLFLRAFPKLWGCGGYELMRTATGSSSRLSVITEGACTSEELKSWCSQRVYLRPIQMDFEIDPVPTDSGPAENCLKCGLNMSLHLLRNHIEECPEAMTPSNICQSFKKCGTHSFNPEVIPSDAYEPAKCLEPKPTAQTSTGCDDHIDEILEKHSTTGRAKPKKKRQKTQYRAAGVAITETAILLTLRKVQEDRELSKSHQRTIAKRPARQ
ncbi:hypothetical protein HOLleu_44077 [Holothuria leucospilota]|uniref:Uncharacterized protein n=1 Tax=Holothuria leucospilota TaxID=206669 RepID=A0A9Q1BAN5_HOLLE|nr:hypothetical protein HOLleu_44077 [Holothuria leucospilota]